MKEATIKHVHLGQPRLIYSNYIYGKRISGITLDCEAVFFRFNVRADGFGNLPADTRQLRKETEGLRDWTDHQIHDWVLQMERKGLIRLYLTRGDWYLHILNFVPLQPQQVGTRTRRYPQSPWEADDNSILSDQSPGAPLRAHRAAVGRLVDDEEPRAIRTHAKGDILFSDQEEKVNRKEDNEKAERKTFRETIFEYWRDKTGRNKNTKMGPERRKKLDSRYGDSTLEECLLAVDGVLTSDYHMARGQYSGGTKYDEIDLILRNRSNVERFGRMAAEKHKPVEDKKKKSEEARRRWGGQSQ